MTDSYIIPGYPPLKPDDVGNAAVEGQIYLYPKVVRKMIDPPINSQRYGNLSYMLFDSPREYMGKPLYGYVKLRGNHETVESAKQDAMRLVRDVDSKFLIGIAEVGAWVPITENTSAIKDIYDVRESDKEIHLRDEAIKQKEKNDERKIKELQEAERKLKEDGDIYDRPESIEYYTMKRVTEITLYQSYQGYLNKLKELEKKLYQTRIELKKIELNHKEYSSEWVSVYNIERSKTRLSKFIPGETQFEDYESQTLEELLQKYPDIKVPDKPKHVPFEAHYGIVEASTSSVISTDK